jgi:hypothetical protein
MTFLDFKGFGPADVKLAGKHKNKLQMLFMITKISHCTYILDMNAMYMYYSVGNHFFQTLAKMAAVTSLYELLLTQLAQRVT